MGSDDEVRLQTKARTKVKAGASLQSTLGARLRALRLSQGLSLREAAARSGLSHSFIRLVEAGESEIAVSRLVQLADVYGAIPADLLSTIHEPSVEFTPLPAGYTIPSDTNEVTVTFLASPSWRMQPVRVELEPGGKLEGLCHGGEEWWHCISGRPTLRIEGVEYPMKAGDTLFLPDHFEHSFLNLQSKTRAVLVGSSLPTSREKTEADAPPRRQQQARARTHGH